MARFSEPAPLAPGQDTKNFDCGIESLNLWLKKHAIQARAVGSARTFVVSDTEQQRVIGYYALTAASISHEERLPAQPKACHATRFQQRYSPVWP